MKRIYSIRAIVWITFLGFPLAGFLALCLNLRTFGKKNLARYTLAFGLLLTVLTYFVYAYLPEEEASFSIAYLFLFYLLFAAGTGYYAVKTQEDDIERYLEDGSEKKGVLRSVGLLTVSFAMTLVLITLAFTAFPFLLPPDFNY